MKSDDYKLGYSRGWNAGSNGKWPEHKPPYPPEKIIKQLILNIVQLRDAADHICATLLEDDDFVLELAPAVDAVDNCLINVSKWLKENGEIK